jgi:DinB superfamily
MPGPLVRALIAHVDSSFEGPNGDYPALLETITGLTAQQAVWRPSPTSNSIWQIVDHLASSKEWQIEMLENRQAESPAWIQPSGDEES